MESIITESGVEDMINELKLRKTELEREKSEILAREEKLGSFINEEEYELAKIKKDLDLLIMEDEKRMKQKEMELKKGERELKRRYSELKPLLGKKGA